MLSVFVVNHKFVSNPIIWRPSLAGLCRNTSRHVEAGVLQTYRHKCCQVAVCERVQQLTLNHNADPHLNNIWKQCAMSSQGERQCTQLTETTTTAVAEWNRLTQNEDRIHLCYAMIQTTSALLLVKMNQMKSNRVLSAVWWSSCCWLHIHFVPHVSNLTQQRSLLISGMAISAENNSILHASN